MSGQVKKRFVITGDAWYARTAIATWSRDVVAEMSCGLDPVGENGEELGGTLGEWLVVWKDLQPGRLPHPQVQVFDDGWRQIVTSGFHEIMAELADTRPTVAEFAAVLTSHGWVDSTARERVTS